MSSNPDFIKAFPDIRLYGEINDETIGSFLRQMEKLSEKKDSLILELSTPGGDPDAARRIGLEIEWLREEQRREIYFLGKTNVYSAGVTIMDAFPQKYRYLARDAVLLIHERRLEKQVDLTDKPLSACDILMRQIHAQIENAKRLQEEGFKRLASGSRLLSEDISQRARDNWYVPAQEALELGLIAGIVP